MSKQNLREQKPHTFPFGSYDIFSYVIPGVTALIAVINFEHWYRRNVNGDPDTEPLTPVASTVLEPAKSIPIESLVYSFVYALTLIAIVYVGGHLISTISGIVLDRIYVYKAHGYPYETLLGLRRHGGRLRTLSKQFYQGLFFWVNLYLIARYISLLWEWPWLRYTLYILEGIIVLGIVLKLAEDHVRLRAERRQGTGHRSAVVRFAKAYIRRIFSLPFRFVGRIAQRYLRTERAFDRLFQAKYKKNFKGVFKQDAEEAGSNNFWLCKLYVAAKAPYFDRGLAYWVNMYTYARNLSTAFYISFLYGFFFMLFRHENGGGLKPEGQTIIASIPLGYLVLAIALLLRFRYIYVGYFNRYLFRCFVYLTEVEADDANGELEIAARWPISKADIGPEAGVATRVSP